MTCSRHCPSLSINMGGCFSAQPAEPTTRHKASKLFEPGSHGNAAENVSSNADVLPESISAISRSKQSIDSVVASTSIEWRSTGFPSIRYSPESAPLRGVKQVSEVQREPVALRVSRPAARIILNLTFSFRAAHPTTAMSVQSHQRLSSRLWSMAAEVTLCGPTHIM